MTSEDPPLPRRRRWPRYSAYGLLTVVGLLVVVVFAAYFALRSPAVMARLLPVANGLLEGTGVELAAERASVDLLGTAKLRGLRLRWADPEQGTVTVTADRLSLAWRPHRLLAGKLHVTHLQARSLAVDGRLTLPPASEPAAAPPAETAAPRPTAPTLPGPPLPVTVDEATVTGGRLDLQVTQAERMIRYRTPWTLRARLALTPDRLAADSDLRLGADTPGRLTARTPAGAGITAAAHPALTVTARGELARTAEGWRLTEAALQPRLVLNDGELTGAGTTGRWQRLLAESELTAKSTDQAGGTGLAGAFPLAVDFRVQAELAGVTGDWQGAADATAHAALDSRWSTRGHARVRDPGGALAAAEIRGGGHLAVPEVTADQDGRRLAGEGLHLEARWQAETTDGADTALPPLAFTVDTAVRAARLSGAAGADAAAGELRQLAHNLHLSGRFDPSEPLPAGLDASLDSGLDLAGLDLRLPGAGAPRTLATGATSLTLTADSGPERGEGRLELQVDEVAASDLDQPVSLTVAAGGASDWQVTDPRLDLSLDLDGRRLLTVAAEAGRRPGRLRLRHDLRAALPAALADLHSAAAPLARIGGLGLDWQGRARLDHDADDLTAVDAAALQAARAEGEGRLAVRQIDAPADPALPTWAEPVTLAYGLRQADDYTAELDVTAPALTVPGVDRPLDLAVHTRQTAGRDLRRLDANGHVRLAGDKRLDYGLSLRDRPGELHATAEAEVRADPGLTAYSPLLDPLQQVGAVTLGADLRAEVTHPHDSARALTAADTARLEAGGELDLRLTQSRPGERLTLDGPLHWQQTATWQPTAVATEARLSLPGAEVAGAGTVAGLAVDLDTRLVPGTRPRGGKASLQVRADSAQPAAPADGPDLAPLLSPARLQVAGELGAERAELTELSATVGDGLARLEARGEAAADARSGTADGRLRLAPQGSLLPEPAINGRGSLAVPWEVTWARGRNYSLSGRLIFDELGLDAGPLALDGLSGEVPFREELVQGPDGGLGFAYTEEPAPFQRVAFSRVRPYLERRFTFAAERLAADGLAAGPLRANLAVEQNLLRLHRLEMAVLDGHLDGELYLDATPGAMAVGLLGRLSQVDLRPLLAEGTAEAAGDYAPVNARAAVSLDLARLLLQGRVDITRITRTQLLQGLALLDPAREDPQLGRVRSALRLAHPERVSLHMRNSLLDLEVALSTGTPVRVRGIPLTPLLQRFAGPALRQLDQLPLNR